MRYIIIIIVLTFSGFVAGGCSNATLDAWNYGMEKKDPGIIFDHARYYHMGTMDVTNWQDPETGRDYSWNTVELDAHPGIKRMCEESRFDGPFGNDAGQYSDSDRRVAYNNCYFPNRFWDAGGSKFHGIDPNCPKPAFDGHIDL